MGLKTREIQRTPADPGDDEHRQQPAVDSVREAGLGSLPADWIEALVLVAETARRSQVPYAVVGTLGIALSQGLDFQAVQGLRGSATPRRRTDLDVFLVASDDARQRFRELLGRAENGSLPPIDVVPTYHEQIQFLRDEARLRYRTITVPVDIGLFTIFEVSAAGLRIPILHPRTHLHMMGQNPPGRRKIRWNIRCLSKPPREDVNFPDLPEHEFRAFHTFKRTKLYQYRARYLLWVLRNNLYEHELKREPGLVVTAKRWFRASCPGVARLIRRGLD